MTENYKLIELNEELAEKKHLKDFYDRMGNGELESMRMSTKLQSQIEVIERKINDILYARIRRGDTL